MTNLQLKVYQLLQTIPKQKVVTYGSLAEAVGNKKLARVIGNILHHNPDINLYPCYKVVNNQGLLARNYAFNGLEGQKALLEKEGIEVINYQVDLNKYQYHFTNES